MISCICCRDYARKFELYGTVRAVVSVCDCVNYITDEKELEQVFRLVNNYLDPEGIFIFDFNTEYKYKEILGEQTIAEDREDCSFIWDNYYYEDESMNEYELTLCLLRDRTAICTANTRKCIIKKHIHWMQCGSLSSGQVWNL